MASVFEIMALVLSSKLHMRAAGRPHHDTVAHQSNRIGMPCKRTTQRSTSGAEQGTRPTKATRWPQGVL
jgi:hypothetical protein